MGGLGAALGSLSFAAPWLLLGLVVLPALWWLLRLLPPAPRRLRFPAIALLFDLRPREETPDRTPPWLILLRILLAALVILALAHPLLNAAGGPGGGGPLLLVIDDGWAAAPHWSLRLQAADQLLAEAERAGRPVALVATAPRAEGAVAVAGPMSPAEARRQLRILVPSPWPVDRAAAAAAIGRQPWPEGASAVWISDGLAGSPPEGDRALAERLLGLGGLTVMRESGGRLARLLLPPTIDQAGAMLHLRRADGGAPETVAVRAVGEDGRLVTRQELRFDAGETALDRKLDLPLELRNRVARLSLEGEESAAATVLLDERWRQRPVGLVSGAGENEAQPLLSDTYYLDRALGPYSEIRRGNPLQLLKRQLAVMVLADVGALSPEESTALKSWIEHGGVLVRFAGERLAQNADNLLPVRLRAGDRTLGGAMSWSKPAHLAPFPEKSPFAGLAIPPDVLVQRQVLAEPEPDLGGKSWARLSDGTPLVTAEHRGEGWLVLVHTTANAEWSNLALSGLFVDMLRRIIGLSQGVVGDQPGGTLPPLQLLDGFGRLAAPPPTALPAEAAVFAENRVGPRHPPGYYGRDNARRALNLGGRVTELAPLGALPAGAAERGFATAGELDLKPWLLGAAFLLLLIDILIAMALRGLLSRRRPGAATAALLLGALLAAGPAAAQGSSQGSGLDDPDAFALAATAQTRLAYVRTGVPAVDDVSNAGLIGLTLVLRQRTAVEAGSPMGVDIEHDELAFFPLLYWPMTPGQALPSPAALQKLNAYLRNGGTILFDTQDQNAAGAVAMGQLGAGTSKLRELVHGLDIPPLVPVPSDHVLTKSFYLLQQFPGRWAGGPVWVERSAGRVNDGVSSVVIGGNDWAGAWAVDENGAPLFPAVPGGERQREMAYRFGVNLVMYALTGNYKSDQVHVPAILERIGQ
ncbi:MAG: DUF4159 domain-containing protein [Dongiaceae bacterium]